MYHIDGFVECPVVTERFNDYDRYEWSHPLYIQLRDQYVAEQTDPLLISAIQDSCGWLYGRFNIRCRELGRIVNGNAVADLLHAIEQLKYRVSHELFHGSTMHVMRILVRRGVKNMNIQLLLAPHDPIGNTLSGMTLYQLMGNHRVI